MKTAKKTPRMMLGAAKQRLRIYGRNLSSLHTIEDVRAERDRYFTERQILFDQSNEWRVFLANKYLKGSGIEIGPAEHPLAVPHWAKVKYVDEISTEDLVNLYPYLKKHDLVHVDVVDDGQSLKKFKDNTQDFIIANHFLEHVIDPIKTLKNFYRVLRPGGIVFMAVPDKRFTFDRLRPITPLERLKEFYNDPAKAEAGKWPMFLESAKYIEGENGDEAISRAEELRDQKFSIHFNVWAQHDLLELLLYIIRTYKFDLDFEAVVKNKHEVIFILQKQAKDNSKETPGVTKARRVHKLKEK